MSTGFPCMLYPKTNAPALSLAHSAMSQVPFGAGHKAKVEQKITYGHTSNAAQERKTRRVLPRVHS
ncbi:hypothetical protein [Desulfovibrio cuneatus]|uniref:hypothetical protein n=1 Tax=Desulfovibrio cuneatus TaxID=159728 RepID=UPI000417E827|nr:hypothetical protein [Desulfovibrio cuneatus]